MNDPTHWADKSGGFAAAATPADLEMPKARFLGKSGSLTELLKGMAALSPDEKKTRRRHQPGQAAKLRPL